MASNGKLLTTVVYLTICVVMVASFPRGAPASACVSLIPDAHGPSTASGASPYTLTLSSTTYSPNQVITVVLGGASFKGFLIVARIDGSTNPVGSLQNTTSDSKRVCTAIPGNNGITHTNNTVKASSTFLWQAPSTSVGAITFHYTVVRGGAPDTSPNSSDYFTDLVSASITPAGDNKRQIKHAESSRRKGKKVF